MNVAKPGDRAKKAEIREEYGENDNAETKDKLKEDESTKNGGGHKMDVSSAQMA